MDTSSDNSPGGCPWQPLLDWLNKEMRQRGLRPSDVARGANIPLSTLSGVLNARHKPSLETLDRLSRYLGRPLDEVRELAGDRPQGPDRTRPADLSGPRLQELGWVLYELAPQLSPEELDWFLDYARHLRDRKRREQEQRLG